MIGDEAFKAVSEIAKTTGKAIDAGEKGGGYLTKTFEDAIHALAEAATDSANGFKIRNRASVAVKTKKHLKSLGLDSQFLTIEERAAIPLIEALSNESDDALQELWAAYIANSTDPNAPVGVTAIITNVISKLEPEDKVVLDRLFELDLAEILQKSLKLTAEDFNTSDEQELNFSLTRFVALGLFSCDNSGSLVLAAGDSYKMPCNVEIDTSIGCFRALPLLLMFKQSIMRG